MSKAGAKAPAAPAKAAAPAPTAAPAPAAAGGPPQVEALSAESIAKIAPSELDDLREVFDLFDFWDGRDGQIDAFKVADVFRCINMNPTVDMVVKHGATKKMGERQYKFEQFLAIYQAISKEKDTGTLADFVEGFKTFDREGQGFISMAEMCQVLTALGERLSDKEMDMILKVTETKADNDGNIKYEDFIKKVMAGPSDKDKE